MFQTLYHTWVHSDYQNFIDSVQPITNLRPLIRRKKLYLEDEDIRNERTWKPTDSVEKKLFYLDEEYLDMTTQKIENDEVSRSPDSIQVYTVPSDEKMKFFFDEEYNVLNTQTLDNGPVLTTEEQTLSTREEEEIFFGEEYPEVVTEKLEETTAKHFLEEEEFVSNLSELLTWSNGNSSSKKKNLSSRSNNLTNIFLKDTNKSLRHDGKKRGAEFMYKWFGFLWAPETPCPTTTTTPSPWDMFIPPGSGIAPAGPVAGDGVHPEHSRQSYYVLSLFRGEWTKNTIYFATFLLFGLMLLCLVPWCATCCRGSKGGLRTVITAPPPAPVCPPAVSSPRYAARNRCRPTRSGNRRACGQDCTGFRNSGQCMHSVGRVKVVKCKTPKVKCSTFDPRVRSCAYGGAPSKFVKTCCDKGPLCMVRMPGGSSVNIREKRRRTNDYDDSSSEGSNWRKTEDKREKFYGKAIHTPQAIHRSWSDSKKKRVDKRKIFDSGIHRSCSTLNTKSDDCLNECESWHSKDCKFCNRLSEPIPKRKSVSAATHSGHHRKYPSSDLIKEKTSRGRHKHGFFD